MKKIFSIICFSLSFLVLANINTFAASNTVDTDSSMKSFIIDMLENPNIEYTAFDSNQNDITEKFVEDTANMSIDEICEYAKENTIFFHKWIKQYTLRAVGGDESVTDEVGGYVSDTTGRYVANIAYSFNRYWSWTADSGIYYAHCTISNYRYEGLGSDQVYRPSSNAVISPNGRSATFTGNLAVESWISDSGYAFKIVFNLPASFTWSC